MDTVVVTGGLGNVGEWVIDGLLAAGYHVVCLDLERPGEGPEGVDCRAVDLTEQGETWEVIHDADPDAVVHLAAYNWTGLVAGTKTFLDNVASTYNVLSAAGVAGARTVNTSSLSALGYFDRRVPDAVPVDESAPLVPDDEYAASKIVGETVAAMVADRRDVAIGSIRPAWVNFPDDYQLRSDAAQSDPQGGQGALWTYIDARDFARLVRAIVETEFTGHETVLACARDTYLTVPTAEALETVYDEPPDASSLEANESPVSTARAAALFGWTPEHSWRDVRGETIEPPGLFE
ncbi:MAG: NAD-dependent epimerase/dehydratase family protein [Haloarculaceae archaeon]